MRPQPPRRRRPFLDEDLSLSRRSFRRSFRSSSATSESSSKDETETKKNTIKVTFTEKTGEEITVNAEIGKSLMEAAHDNDVELEGACEGVVGVLDLSRVVEDQNVFDKLPEACDDENDMLDLAFGLTETSPIGVPNYSEGGDRRDSGEDTGGDEGFRGGWVRTETSLRTRDIIVSFRSVCVCVCVCVCVYVVV